MEEFARQLIGQALKYQIDDIHLLPQGDRYIVYLRDQTGLVEVMRMDLAEGQQFLSYLKFQANLNIGEKRRPQSGSLSFNLGPEESIELRLSFITNYQLQESLVIRLLHGNRTSLKTNTFFPGDLEILSRLIHYRSGLLLVSGPVASGKTTTLYQLLRERASQEKLQIITMEDPVEIREPSFLQTEVNEQAGITYEGLIKACLRHHPDIMMIGEIRDEETARMVVRGALTGHLMIATLHAKDVYGVLARMLELGVSKNLLQETLLAIVSQRLLPVYCPICQGPCQLDCNHLDLSQKKATLFDCLRGPALEEAIQASDQVRIATWDHTFNRKLRKVYGLGYLTEDQLQTYHIQ